jgi:hypothetical protein
VGVFLLTCRPISPGERWLARRVPLAGWFRAGLLLALLSLWAYAQFFGEREVSGVWPTLPNMSGFCWAWPCVNPLCGVPLGGVPLECAYVSRL